MENKWLVKNVGREEEIIELKDNLKVDRIIATLLHQRGLRTFEEARKFLNPDLNDLHDPYLMKNMDSAVERLIQALDSKDKILLFGDYDVDGTTAVALMHEVLKNHHKELGFYIPDRYSEGYGISTSGIDFAKENGFSLIIALDCGIKAIEKVEYAKSLGIDFIICDHHEPGDIVPNCIVLDPKQSDCSYPFKELSGCGVGFKLLQGLYKKMNLDYNALFAQLDLLAISIGADIVPVIGENRILCYQGLKLLNEKPRAAFQELIELAGKKFPLNLTDVVFIIAPRINAAGRLRTGKAAVELMISTDQNELTRIAKEINADNSERKTIDKEITDEALQQISSDPHFASKSSTVVFKETWHKGVVGIVASRLIETHFRPTIVLTQSNGMITGSARSVNNFDLYNALLQCDDLLEQFGGHKHAAGMSLKPENLEDFKKRFEEMVAKTISIEDKTPIQKIDVSINLNEIHGTESPHQ
ncbi:MAG: single-stranded-DNA-specific exonuclease RecJ, partial [Bacteroidetes bacterium]|nr:single-stranded-DNA-specific exonuclease RecJ [Bacteroidota bacterium]